LLRGTQMNFRKMTKFSKQWPIEAQKSDQLGFKQMIKYIIFRK
jgi:hypothetical protein